MARFENWYQRHFLIIFAVGMVLLWSFHQAMQVQKTKLLEEADTLGQSIVSIEKELAEGPPSEKANVLKDQLAAMQQRYEAIQNMPTWPVDTNTLWKFAGGLVVQIFVTVLGALISKLFSPH